MIQKASECTVKIFMRCLFDKDLTALCEQDATEEALKQAFQAIYMEYIDLSGISQSTELHLLKSIQGLQCRVTLMEAYINLHRECIRTIGLPFFPAFKEMKKYGHALWWEKDNQDVDIFLNKLEMIGTREKRYKLELKEKVADLMKYTKSISDEKPEQNISRKAFIRQLNQLQKAGFMIDKDKTTVEDLALMVLDYTENIEASINK